MRVRGGPERLVIHDIEYNARGQRTQCEYADPTSAAGSVVTTVQYTYEPETFRLSELRTTRGTTKLQHLLYTYDPVGNITSLRNQADNAPFFSGTPPVSGDGLYVYDALYRLIEATGREHPGLQPVDTDPAPGTTLPHANDTSVLIAYTERYQYDDVGNIERISHLAGPSGSAGWTRNYEYATDSNRLLFTSVPGSPLSLTEAYSYDAHGSMSQMPHLALLEWDYADRLQHTEKSAGDVQDTYFTYNGGGERVRKVFVTTGTIKERIYLGGYELYRERPNTPGSAVTLERQTLHVMDDQRRIAMVETKTRENGADIASPVSRWRFQLDNHLGSSTVELDHAGSVISYEEYHPYGSTAFHVRDGNAEVSAKRYRYTGKERDEETGLCYHGARYYAAWLGRWTTSDPAGVADGTNLYRYSRNNPLRLIDPNGMQSKPFAEKGTANYEIGSRSDSQLLGYLRKLSAEQRGNLIEGATGRFRQRAQAFKQKYELTTITTLPVVTIEGSTGRSEPYAQKSPDDTSKTIDLPHFVVAPKVPSYLVRKEYPELARQILKSGLSLDPEVHPSKSSLTPVEHALGLHKATGKPTPFLSVSELFPGGAKNFTGSRIFINKDVAAALGADYITHKQLAEMITKEHPNARWLETNPAIEREGLYRGSVPGAALEGPGTVALRYGARGLAFAGTAVTVYNLGAAAEESVEKGTPAPIAAQTVREAGGWSAAVAGAKVGAALGAAAGIETGPGAILTGLAGAFVFGAAGYAGADWIADYIYEN